MNYDTQLYHFGIKGMKWGVRRFENYDGTYTQAGLKRYRESERGYDAVNAVYKNAKDTSSKQAVKQLKQTRKAFKRQMKNDYRQLKRDKLGDKGKELYRSGKTITGNEATAGAVGTIAAGTFAAHNYLKKNGKKKESEIALYAGAGAGAVTLALRGIGAVQNRRLRAYYGHSRPSDKGRLDFNKEMQKAIDTHSL